MTWEVIVGFAAGLFKSISRILDILKSKSNINTGRALEQAEQAKAEAELNRQQTEILVQNRKTEDTIKKMEDGTF